MKILIIEDDPVSMKLVSAVLQAGGHDVLPAMSADQAMVSVKTFRPDVILLDLQLPGIEGFSVARQCRANPATRLIPIIAVTAFSEDYRRADALEAGCDSYLIKPLNTRTLLQQVESVVFEKAQQFQGEPLP